MHNIRSCFPHGIIMLSIVLVVFHVPEALNGQQKHNSRASTRVTSSLRMASGESERGSSLTMHHPHLQQHLSTSQAKWTAVLAQDQQGQQFLVQ